MPISGDVNYSREVTPHVEIKLDEIIECSNKTFKLREVGCYRPGLSRLRNVIGHYYTVCKRGKNNWEVFDDMKKNTIP